MPARCWLPALLLASSPLVASPLAAQSPTAAPLRFGSDTLEVSELEGTLRHRVALAVQTTSRTTVEGQEALLQVFEQWDEAGPSTTDSVWVAFPSLQPLRHRRHGTASSVALEFGSDSIRGRAGISGRPVRNVSEHRPATFYSAGTTDLVARAMPMRAGATLEAPFYLSGMGFTTITYTVAGEETIALRDNRTRRAWRVELRWSGLPGVTRVYVDRETRDLLLIADDTGGRELRYAR